MVEGDVKRWLKYGFFGCLGCLGLIVIVVGLTVGTAWFRAKSEKPEERVLTHPVPAAPIEPIEPVESRQPGTASSLPRSASQGTLALELQDGEFHIQPGVAGEPIRVEATFDKTSYDLVEKSETLADGTWAYRIEFRRTKPESFVRHVVQQMFSSIRPSVRVFLPPDAPIALEARVERGGLEIELGGTRVVSAVINVSIGGVELKVSEPLADPMERLAFTSNMGGGELQSIGNASPRILEVEAQMGGVELDLGGAWRADSEIKLHGSMGGMSVQLPSGVRIEGVPGRAPEGPQSDELKLPTLRFSASSEMGEVEFR